MARMAQGLLYQAIRQPGILRQQRAVHVGTVGVVAPRPLGTVAAIVAVPGHDAPQRTRSVEHRPPAVILEAHDLAIRPALRVRYAHQHVAYKTLLARARWLGVEVHDPDAGQPLAVGGLVVVPH